MSTSHLPSQFYSLSISPLHFAMVKDLNIFTHLFANHFCFMNALLEVFPDFPQTLISQVQQPLPCLVHKPFSILLKFP